MKFSASSLVMLLAAALSVPGWSEEDRWEKAQKQYEENVRIAALHPVKELKKAIEDGDAKKVTKLLDEGCPVSVPMPVSAAEWEGIPPTDYPIILAVRQGHIEIVRLLLDRGADPKSKGYEVDTTPLHQANDLEIAKLLISRGADVNARESEGCQPIHHAAIPGYIENGHEQAAANSVALIKFLIEKGADPLAEDDIKTQPIHFAVSNNSAEAVSLFLNLNAKIDATIQHKEDYFRNGWQLIHFAAQRDDENEALKIAELLLSKGANINATTAEGKTPLHLSKLPAMTKLLLSHKAKIDIVSTGSIQEQPIHHFAMHGDVESLKMLLEHDADIEASSARDEQSTPLDTAAFWGRVDAVKFLLERGAKPTERTMKNARRFDDNPIKIVSLLHQHGGRVSADMFLSLNKDRKALLPLLDQQAKADLLAQAVEQIADASEAGDLDLIRDLVSLGAKLDQPWGGLLPIHYAVMSDKIEVIEYFLTAGQPINSKGTFRDEDVDPPVVYTDIQPIHLAGSNPEIIPYLIKKGAKIDALTGEGWQLVHLAAAHGDLKILKAVIANGGNPKAKTTDGKTPLQLAREFTNKENEEYLSK